MLLAVDREPHVSTLPAGSVARGVVFILTRPLQAFVGTEARGALLLPATVTALVWANSPWLAGYEELSKDLRHWRAMAVPAAAAAGGMVVPALVYLGLNAGDPAAGGADGAGG